MKTAEKIFSFVKSFLGHMGFYFTFTVMAFAIFLTSEYPDGNMIFKTELFWWILLFSAIYSLCNFVLKIKFIESYVARIAIHYVLIVLDFSLVIAYGAYKSNKAYFVILAFAFVYLLVEIVRGVMFSISNRKKNEETEYETLFTK